MIKNRISEKGERSLKIVAVSVTLLFVIAAAVPLFWMIVSSLKDEKTIDAYPPKFLPTIPIEVGVTLDYSGLEVRDAVFYEKEAMMATWFPWMKNLREGIGQVSVTGVRDGKVIYKAWTPSSSFHVGQPFIVPSTLFNMKMMDAKLPVIREKGLSKFRWYGELGDRSQEAAGVSDGYLSGRFGEFYRSTSFVSGKIVAIQEKPKFIRMFDSYVSLAKLAQDKAGYLGFFKYFWNSSIVTICSVIMQLVLGGMAGYALSHLVGSPRLKFFLLLFFLATIFIPDISLLIPLYMTMKQLHLVDTLLSVILPHSAWGIVIFLFKGFFDQLPKELMQAARVDGASEFRTFTQLVIPLSIPIFTVVAVLTFIPVWNEFLWPLIVTKSPENWTFTVALNDLQNQSGIQQNTIMASSFVATIPLLIVFLTSQKYIEKGVAFTGVKG